MVDHPRILVADDEPEMLESVADALTELGADVVRARTGGDLIEKIGDEGPFDLVVTDVSMPWMTGVQAMHSARTAGLATPIIVMTALRGERIVEQVRALGHAAVLLSKPFALSELEAVVTRLLRDHGASLPGA